MTSAADARVSLTGKLGLKPLTCQNAMFYYVPMQGVLSYTALSINVMNPSLILRVFPKRDVTNLLLANTVLGVGLYIYNSRHLQTTTKDKRVLFSAFGATIFSLGSVLSWAILRSILPQNTILCTLAGIGSGVTLIQLGRTYIGHVDSLVKATE